MLWKITGADANTGDDVLIEVEAEDKRSAEMLAKKQRVLMSSVEQVPEESAAPPVAVPAMDHRRLARRADVLEGVSFICSMIGWLLVAVGIIVAMVGLLRVQSGDTPFWIGVGLAGASYGLLMVVIGAAIGLFSSIALALRDAARASASTAAACEKLLTLAKWGAEAAAAKINEKHRA